MKQSVQVGKATLALGLALGVARLAWADDMASPAATTPSASAAPMASAEGGKGGQMAEKLGLSGDQADKFKAEQKQFREAAKPLRDKEKGLLETLGTQVASKAADADINATIASLESARKDLDAARTAHEAALKGILSPSQYAQVVLQMAEGREERGAKK
jgi:Spy/CpxP family protein refolding chaperone